MAEITATAARTFTTYLEGAPEGITDWQVRIYDTADNVVVGPAIDDLDTVTAGVTETQVNPDEVLYATTLTAPTPAADYEPDADGRYLYTVAWMSGGVESEPDVLFVTTLVVFATLDQLALRLGKSSSADLTAAQQAQGDSLLELVTALITAAVDQSMEWAAALTPVPAVLRGVCLEAVARVMQNPSGARSESEQLGAYQHSQSFTDNAHGLVLTDAEVMLCRRAVHGRLSGSSRPLTTLDDLIELSETGEIVGSV